MAEASADENHGADGIANEMLMDDLHFFCTSICGLNAKGAKPLHDAVTEVLHFMNGYSCPTEVDVEKFTQYKWNAFGGPGCEEGEEVSLEFLFDEMDNECKITDPGDEESMDGYNNPRRNPQSFQRNISRRLDEETLDALAQLLAEVPDTAGGQNTPDTLEESKSNTTPLVSNRTKSFIRTRSCLLANKDEPSNFPLAIKRVQSCRNALGLRRTPSTKIFGFSKLAEEMEKVEFVKLSRGRTTTVRFQDTPMTATSSQTRTCMAKPGQRNRSISVESFGSKWEYLGDNHLDGEYGSSVEKGSASSPADPVLSPEDKKSDKHKSFWRLQMARKILKQRLKHTSNSNRRQFGRHRSVSRHSKSDNITVEEDGSVQVDLKT